MYKMMKKLIEKKFYKTADEAQNKLDSVITAHRL